MEKPEDETSEEEGRLLELLGILIEEYENRAHRLPKAAPHKMLACLLEEKGMKPSDLWTVLPRSRVSEILSGKRGINKAQASAVLPTQAEAIERAKQRNLQNLAADLPVENHQFAVDGKLRPD